MTAERLWCRVVKGPAPEDCQMWTGAIGDDGCGRSPAPSPPEPIPGSAPGRVLPTRVAVCAGLRTRYGHTVPACRSLSEMLQPSLLAPSTSRRESHRVVGRMRHFTLAYCASVK
ncbi:hypothetical protein C5E08_13995 [Rathayibacter iranicus]|uniref:Uncharacterized protein n=1 Tax=Rathayibacter iranicus TaxID=59737 RepID=A0AAD1AIB2_9MICO|nr:hypothetical protein C7V51_14240 [Rathayibacter iranicus]PPI42419.1 hypothetical protein C5E09_13095 [Rathayibacter iranicus]PPI57841.1 hypothetical protein C5E08_13995 [Rathayibacter iranicus]PPI68779.1 hypothetical protein C5E01_13050 [Rathayibacter iranicus]